MSRIDIPDLEARIVALLKQAECDDWTIAKIGMRIGLAYAAALSARGRLKKEKLMASAERAFNVLVARYTKRMKDTGGTYVPEPHASSSAACRAVTTMRQLALTDKDTGGLPISLAVSIKLGEA